MVEYVEESIQRRVNEPRENKCCEAFITVGTESQSVDKLIDRDGVTMHNKITDVKTAAYGVILTLPETTLQDVVEIDAVLTIEDTTGLEINPNV